MATGKPTLQEGYSNPDLAARLKAYQNRTGEFKNKKGGAKFTAPTEGKPTGDRKRGAQQAKEWGDRKRVSQGRSVYDTKPAIRAGNGNRPAGIVRGPSPSMLRAPNAGATRIDSGGSGYSGPGLPSVPTQPMGAPPRSQGNYRPTPLTRTQQPLVYAPQGPLPPTGYGGDGMAGNQSYRRTGELQTSAPIGGGYQAPQQRPSMFTPGAPPQPQYNPLPQQPMQPQGPRPPMSFSNNQPQYGQQPSGPMPQYTMQEIQQLIQMMNGGGQAPPQSPWGRGW